MAKQGNAEKGSPQQANLTSPLLADKVRKMIAIWFGALSDLFINLSAGWFGAAIILPLYTRKPKFRPLALIINLEFGIFALMIAVYLRSNV